ncbi:MAG TPA: hypothetical protein VLA22_05860, partial [Gaiellaceae bacterium]|nr:hypothetical protein [Gaiellaceae bacterium]
MPMRPSRSRAAAAALGIAVAIAIGAAGARAQEPSDTALDEAGWQGVLGVRPAVSTAQRFVVLLRSPSLAARVRAVGGLASEEEMRGWTD